MAEEVLFKPKELYTKQLKDQYHQAAIEYYEGLEKAAHTDLAANKLHVADYNKKQASANKKQAELSSTKTKTTICLVAFILLLVAGAIALIYAFLDGFKWVSLLVGLILLGIGIGLIFLYRKLKKAGAEQSAKLAKLQEAAEQALRTCYADMAALNRSFDWNAPLHVMEKATPIIDLDPRFTPERLSMLMDNYGLGEELSEDVSVLGVLSGRIKGNPFLLERTLSRQIVSKVYHGSLTISWTTYSRDSEGRSYPVTHTQTLTASVAHPAPEFINNTNLIYGNDAAPHLSFTRGPSKASRMEPKERRKAIDKFRKELAKKAEKSIGTDHPFTPMGNDEFECLFNALDRDNDVEFRLLFTPLAQQNMVDLLEDPEPYGDDFNFYKRKKINVIASTHSQSFDYSADPNNFIGYDGAEMKERFVAYCDSFIRSLFFDLAPLLSIPLYQMHKSRDYIYKNTYPRNITSFEQEALANGLSPETFRPRTADPTVPSILKVHQKQKEGKSDLVEVEATAFETYRMVDYVPVMGGDGRSHNVPVPWIRYEKVSKVTPMAIKEVGKDRYGIGELVKNNQGLNNFLTQFSYRYERGLLAFASDELQSVDDQALSGYFADKDNKK